MADRDSRAGLRYADAAILDYTDQLHAGHDAALEAAFTAPDREAMPAIQVGRSEGKLLGLLVAMIGARKVVEVGSLAGYSGLRLARALPPDGHLYSIEVDPRHAEVTRQSLALGGVAERATVLVGGAAEVLPTLERHGPFDAVFLDADKAGYAHYGAWAARNLRPGGLLIGDNAYLFGHLCDDSDEARAMRQFHEDAARNFDSVCIPTPDGILVGIRRG